MCSFAALFRQALRCLAGFYRIAASPNLFGSYGFESEILYDLRSIWDFLAGLRICIFMLLGTILESITGNRFANW